MRKVFCGILVAILGGGLFAGLSHAATYYVSTDSVASDTNPGTLSQPWRTITKSATTAVAGDTVYVKGGNYGGEHVVVSNSGTVTDPIVFEGCDGIPVLDGADWTGNGFYANGKSYVEVRNLRIKNYLYGAYVDYSSHITFDGIVADSCYSSTSTSNGHGIWARRSSYCAIINCTTTNNGGNNIYLSQSSYCTIQNCRVYGTLSSTDAFASDYYIVAAWSSNNLIRDCVVEDKAASGKGNHGIGIKDDVSQSGTHSGNNRIISCTAKNFEECFYVAHQAYNTLIDSCVGNNLDKGTSFNNVLMARDGAYNNTFSNCTAFGRAHTVCVYDGVEGSTSQAQTGNTFINCTLEGGTVGAFLRNSINTTFKNCTFIRSTYLFRFSLNVSGVDSSTGTLLQNCILSGMANQYDTRAFAYPWTYDRTGLTETGYSDMGDVTAAYTDFWAGFAALSGTGNLAVDPLFADSTSSDFHLKSAAGRWNGTAWVKDTVQSPCIDAGCDTCFYGNEPEPNGGRINMGRYGNTAVASKSSSNPTVYVTMAPDSTGDFVCDGANDEIEINAALAFADTNEVCRTVFLSGPAVYVVSDTLKIGGETTLTGSSGTVVKVANGSSQMAVIRTKANYLENIAIHGFEIDGNRANNTAACALCVIDSAKNVEIFNLTLHDATADLIDFRFGDTGSIHDNILSGGGGDGILVYRAKNVSICRNTIAARVGTGIKSSASDTVTISGNTVYGTSEAETAGIRVQRTSGSSWTMKSVEITGNTVYNMDQRGIDLYSSTPTLTDSVHVHHNVLYNCGATAPYAGVGSYALNVLFENNVVDSCAHGSFAVAAGGDGTTAGFVLRVRNNIFSNSPGDTAVVFRRAATETMYLRNNCLYNCALGYNDSVSAASGNITDDPRFADAAAHDYHLKSEKGRWDGSAWTQDAVTSPCIDAGDSTSDYSNEPFPNGSRINVGRYGNTTEASKTSVPTPPVNAVLYLSVYPDQSGDIVCDGVDDHVEINAALAMADTSGLCNTIYLKGSATYTIDTTLWVGGNLTLTGDSTAVVKLADTANWEKKAPMIRTSAAGLRNITICGFEIDGNDANNYDTDNTLATPAARGLGKYYYTAIQIDSLAVNVEVYDMYIHNNMNDGINILAADSVSVHDNRLIRIGYDGINVTYCKQVAIHDNVIQIRKCAGIRPIGSDMVKIYNNRIFGLPYASPTEGQYGIYLVRRGAEFPTTDMEIYGNSISGIYYVGIQAQYQTGYGTALSPEDAYASIHHNTIYGCGAGVSSAGGICSYSFNLAIANNVIDSCKAGGFGVLGTGSEVGTGYTIRLLNNIFSNTMYGGTNRAVYNLRPTTESVHLENNCFFGNTTNYLASDSIFAAGDVLDDPLFADSANHDYHLKSQQGRWDGTAWVTDSFTSPCIDAGVDTCFYGSEPAPNGSRINIGRYGNTSEASKTAPGSVAADTPLVFSLAQNVPNPFNPSTTIAYTIPSACMVTMTVYNIAGQKVAMLVRETQPAGVYTVRWQPENLASGVFFCRIEAGGSTKTMKLLYMK